MWLWLFSSRRCWSHEREVSAKFGFITRTPGSKKPFHVNIKKKKKSILNFTLCFSGGKTLNSGKSCSLCFISALTSNLLLMRVSKILFLDPQLPLKLLFLIITSKHSYMVWELGFIWSRGSKSTKWCFFFFFFTDWNPEQSRLQSRSDYTYHCYICSMSHYLFCYSFQKTINDQSISQCLWSICLSFSVQPWSNHCQIPPNKE